MFGIQKAGTFIVLGAFSIIIAMLITDISLKKLVVNTVQKAKTIKESTANMFLKEDEEMDEPVFIKELDEPSMVDNNSSTNTGRSKIIDFPLMQQQKEAPKTELENQIPIQFASKKTKNIVEKRMEHLQRIHH